MVALITGKHIVTADATLTAGTTLVVEPVVAGIPNGTVLTFSSGQTATVNATVNAGDRAITVLSTTITSGARALAPATGSGLPVTPNGGNINITWDNGANKIFKL
jgi:NAD-dependent SIR2 family protein deacetylase